MIGKHSQTWRFRVGAMVILCTGAILLAQRWLPTGRATPNDQVEPARWDEVGQIKFVAINPIVRVNGWLMTWTNQGVWASPDNGDSWEEANQGLPETSAVSGLFAYGTKVFALVNRQLYVSIDAGGYWENVPDAPFALVPPVLDSLVNHGGTLILGAQRGIIYRSQDGGRTWTARRALPDGAVTDLVSAGNRLLAATERGVFISNDVGETWQEPTLQVSYWLPHKETFEYGKQVRTLAMVNSRVFAATWGGGVFCSEDKGETWDQVNEGLDLEESYDSLYVSSFIKSGRRLLAGTKVGIFATPEHEVRWQESNSGLARRSVDRLFSLNGQIYATNIGAGAFASKDNGLNWNAAEFPEQIVSTTIGRVAGFHESNGKLWAYSGGPDGAKGVGYAYSLDDGATWTPMPQISNIRAQVSASGYLFRATPNGITRSANDGLTFEPFIQGLNITGRPPAGVNTLTTDAAQLFAGTEEQGVFAAPPSGSRWTRRANRGLAQTNVRTLTFKDSMLLAGTKEGGVFLSDNKGDDWAAASQGLSEHPVNDLLIGQFDIWAATQGGGVFGSNDNGKSWKAVNQGLDSLQVNDLALQGQNLLAATAGGVYVSADAGHNWTALNNGLPDQPITAVFALGNKLFAGTEDGRILYYNPTPAPTPTPTPTPDPNATPTPTPIPTPAPLFTPLPRITPVPTPTPSPTPTPDLGPRTIFYVGGRLTDQRGQGLVGANINAGEIGGDFTTNALTDRNGYYSLRLAVGKSYRVTPPAEGPRVNYAVYYPNPGFAVVSNLQEDQTVNFAYTLTAPWTPPQ
jgi:photosystem II stability/assembly factor-like uncharacterized protein